MVLLWMAFTAFVSFGSALSGSTFMVYLTGVERSVTASTKRQYV